MGCERVKIGWARRDVTPIGKASLCGQFFLRISDRVRDPLKTVGLALENESAAQQAIIVSLDAAKVSDFILDTCRSKLKTDLPEFAPENLFISATHTHTAPGQESDAFEELPGLPSDVMSGKEYALFLVEKICQAAVDAWTSRKFGAISWGRAKAVVGFNRRVSYFNGVTQMYGNTDDPDFSHIEGHEDHNIEILFTYDQKHKLTGMLLNVPCPAQCTERGYFVSADYWHDAREIITGKYGKDIFILPQCSAAGDLSPRTMINRPADLRMMELKGYGGEFEYEYKYDVARRRDIADKISAAVDEVLPLVANDIHDKIVFSHVVDNMELQRRLATQEDLDLAMREVANWTKRLENFEKPDVFSPEYTATFRRVGFYQKIVDTYHAQQNQNKLTMPVELHSLRIGDVAMCTNRFEYYMDYGMRIKSRSKALQTFIVQLAGNGSYLPTLRSVSGGNYGACPASAPVGPEGGQMIVEHQVAAINKMFEKGDPPQPSTYVPAKITRMLEIAME